MNDIALLFLSYGRHHVVERTLASYEKYGLLEVVDEKRVFFQNICDEDKKIANDYGFETMGSSSNEGISMGFKNLVQACNSTHILLLENDWELIEDARDTILDARKLLANNDADVVRLRHRLDPGHPLHSRNFEGDEIGSENAKRHLMNCIHWIEHPERDFPDYVQKDCPDWYTASSKYANFTNNPCMYRRDWYEENVFPFCKHGSHLEPEIDTWWASRNFKVAQGEGLFKHNDK